MLDKIKNLVDQWVWYVLNKSKTKKDVSVYNILSEVQDDKDYLDLKEYQTLDEQKKDLIKPEKKWIEFFTYLLTNFKNKLYLFSLKDYKTWNIIKGTIRWWNKIEAWENAQKVYWLSEKPDKIIDIDVSPDRLLDKFIVNPTFYFSKKVKKWQLGEFLIEYSSLMEDWFDKKDTIDVLKDIIKDRSLLEFMEVLKTSNLKVSALMEKSGLFDDYTVSIIESAELAGWDSKLYEWFTNLWISYKNEAEFREKFIKSMYYPGFLILMIILILVGTITKVIPILAWLFIEIAGEDKLPWTLLTLLAFWDNFWIILVKVIFGIGIIVLIKKILLTNSILLWFWNQMILKLPLFWEIFRILEENRIFRILIQTKTSNLSEMQKIQSFEKATPNILYKWVYRFMWKKYPSIRDLTRTIESANNNFGGEIFWKRMITVLNLAKWETSKVLSKYESFLKKNTELLYERLKTVNFVVTILSTLLIWLTIVWIFWTVFWVVINLANSQ